ncbi:probable N-acetyltransferase camello isoform X3 [Spea bombifrons]|uniref:probable N-acetyltransferase camello isoform X3 n=1 Tax=Spea bombifrons TaxID=233779 RepID=UPI0023498782|nr:probable N-acetyltransferase camello isoform X3 [Spea bombifrons]XP_053314011.1 probable N-acetyltransferase camello isoform X3 [Spea bombifrons]XP_053314012.1 probable N-acetyltransferase camello isoform X3 [Spea bombifrons]
MADYSIRLYRDSDYTAVRDLFAEGTIEHTRVAFKHAFTLRRVWIFLGVVFLLPLLLVESIAFSIGSLALALVGLWLGTRDLYASYVRHALSDDMLDIKKYYLQRDGHCFWVAESDGVVVGMVAAVPSSYPGGERHTELKRMSVARSHRGKGIAKALCRTLIDFSRERGCQAVVLETTLGHQAAHNLYKRMGFRWQHSTFLNHPLAKAVDFKFFFYKFDIPTRRQ